MFDLNIVSCNIRNARTSKNMTQMNLADALGVSFQAVSNWERGNSMPDIGKISDICNVLDITFEELVGEKSRASEIMQKVMKDENAIVALEDLVEIAPIVNPSQIESVIVQECGESESIDIGVLCGLAPYLSKEALDRLASLVYEVDLGALAGLAPFMSQDTLGRLADKVVEVDLGVLCGIAPFLSKEKIDKLAERVAEVDTGALAGLAPFLSQEAMEHILTKMITK